MVRSVMGTISAFGHDRRFSLELLRLGFWRRLVPHSHICAPLISILILESLLMNFSQWGQY